MRKFLNSFSVLPLFLILLFSCSNIEKKESLLSSIGPVKPGAKKSSTKLNISEVKPTESGSTSYLLYLSSETSLCLPEIKNIGTFHFGTLLLSVLDLNISNSFYKKDGSVDWNRYLLMNKITQNDSLVPYLNLPKISEINLKKNVVIPSLKHSISRDEDYLRNYFKKVGLKQLTKLPYILISAYDLPLKEKYVKVKKLGISSLSSILMLKKHCKMVSKEIMKHVKKD